MSTVRRGTLRCGRCREWKDDGAFPRNANPRYEYRRYRGGTCNACVASSRARREKTPRERRDAMAEKRARLDPGPLYNEEDLE